MSTGNYMLKFWGHEEPLEKNRLRLNATTDENGACYLWFCLPEAREQIRRELRNSGLATMEEDGPWTQDRVTADIKLAHGGKTYEFTEDYGYGLESDTVIGMWEDGNYSCDCNRGLFIQQHCDEAFPEMECGETIELLSLEVNSG